MAKTEHYYTRFEKDGIYHVYNRTVDKKPMFTSDDNYAFFIRQFDKYLSDYIKIYAYCLLGNHFHFMIKVNDLTDLTTFKKLSNLNEVNDLTDLTTFKKLSNLNEVNDLTDLTTFKKLSNLNEVNDLTDLTTFKKLSNLNEVNDLTDLTTFEKLSNLKTTHDIVSHQFKKFFQSYAMAFNKQQNRVGTLFQTPFKRVRVEDENYLRELVCYINTNAQKHNLVENFKEWKWSSYNSIVYNKKTKLLKDELIGYFNDVENLIYCHQEYAKRIDEVERDFFIED